MARFNGLTEIARPLSGDSRYTVSFVVLFGVLPLLYLLFGESLGSWMFNNHVSIGIVEPGRWDISSHDGYLKAAERWFEQWYLRIFVAGLLSIFMWKQWDRLLAREAPASGNIPLSLLSALLVIAWANRFIQDDAFISFRYAQHLAGGYGLLWNIGGTPVEGYTNFLWTGLMTIPHLLKQDPVRFSWILGMICYCCTLVFMFRLSNLLTTSWRASVFVMLLLGTNFTFSSYATGGLETQSQVALLILFAYLSIRTQMEARFSSGRLLALSSIAALCMLTRLDSVLLLFPMTVMLFWSIWKESRSRRSLVSRYAALLLPGLMVGALYVSWKMSYYGELLPNTYYAKAAHDASMLAGLRYVHFFLMAYGLYPFAAVLIYDALKTRKQLWAGVLLITAVIWTSYVVSVGGCFMEYRLMVPILPLLLLLVVASLQHRLAPVVQGLVVIGLIAASLMQSHVLSHPRGVVSIRGLHAQVYSLGWDRIGYELGKQFSDAIPEVVIATTAAGALPYFSGLSVVDMHGLSDPIIARSSVVVGERPGHQHLPTLEYLLHSGVHIVIGHPRLLAMGESAVDRDIETKLLGFHRDLLPDAACRIDIPIGKAHRISVLYLQAHPAIENAIRQGRIVKSKW